MKNITFEYETVTKEAGEKTITYRAFRNIPYCKKPVNKALQTLSVFAPEEFFAGGSINGYDIESAPVFFANTVGGYMEGSQEEPGYKAFRDHVTDIPNSLFKALAHGYVCVSSGIRGRKSVSDTGEACGFAPAFVIDQKAAIRFLHANADALPGDMNRIIINGTSAGGALTSLAGATCDHPDYDRFLEEIGAANASDQIFAVSSYCPITNLDHADMAYEWEFDGVYEFDRMRMNPNEGGRPGFSAEKGKLDDERIEISRKEAALFPAYVNSLNLKDENGEPLTLDADGNGSFKEYIKKIVLFSANRQIEEHIAEKYKSGPRDSFFEQPHEKDWITIENGKAIDMDFAGWAKEITRMKNAPAFDDITGTSPENNEFGDKHFTKLSFKYSHLEDPKMADEDMIKCMNPMNYIEDYAAHTCTNWRIRHGERDRDTSLAISAILALKLMNCGANVDYQTIWERPHSGDYDLSELFAWIDGLCK